MASVAVKTNLRSQTGSDPAGLEGNHAFLTVDAGLELEDFQKLYIDQASFGLIFDGGDGNPDRQIVRFRQLAALTARLTIGEKMRVAKMIVAEARKLNKQVKEQVTTNLREGNTDHPGFEIPDPVIAEVKAFLKGEGDLSDLYYSQAVDGSGWRPRPMENIERDETGIEVEPHIGREEHMPDAAC